MKNIMLVFLASLTILAHTQEPDPMTPLLTYEAPPRNHFSYFSLGTSGLILPVLSPEASLGLRKLCTHHAWDLQGGSSITGKYFWGQISYLYFFLPTIAKSYSSPYLGIGLTGGYTHIVPGFFDTSTDFQGKLRPYGNLPITVGLQWGKEERNQFCQIQFSLLFITALSYGVGF